MKCTDYNIHLEYLAATHPSSEYTLTDGQLNDLIKLKLEAAPLDELFDILVNPDESPEIFIHMIKMFSAKSATDQAVASMAISEHLYEQTRNYWYDSIYEEFEAAQERAMLDIDAWQSHLRVPPSCVERA